MSALVIRACLRHEPNLVKPTGGWRTGLQHAPRVERAHQSPVCVERIPDPQGCCFCGQTRAGMVPYGSHQRHCGPENPCKGARLAMSRPTCAALPTHRMDVRPALPVGVLGTPPSRTFTPSTSSISSLTSNTSTSGHNSLIALESDELLVTRAPSPITENASPKTVTSNSNLSPITLSPITRHRGGRPRIYGSPEEAARARKASNRIRQQRRRALLKKAATEAPDEFEFAGSDDVDPGEYLRAHRWCPRATAQALEEVVCPCRLQTRTLRPACVHADQSRKRQGTRPAPHSQDDAVSPCSAGRSEDHPGSGQSGQSAARPC